MADFAASAAVNVVYHIYTTKERLDKLEDIIDGLPNFRGTISGLEELLNDIDQVYVRALTLARINGGSLHRQLDRSLEDCRRNCEEINLILISILETRTTLLKKQKYASKEPRLLGLRKDLEESKSTLGLTMRTIRYVHICSIFNGFR
jgi:citrate lyase beta subunit